MQLPYTYSLQTDTHYSSALHKLISPIFNHYLVIEGHVTGGIERKDNAVVILSRQKAQTEAGEPLPALPEALHIEGQLNLRTARLVDLLVFFFFLFDRLFDISRAPGIFMFISSNVFMEELRIEEMWLQSHQQMVRGGGGGGGVGGGGGEWSC